MKNYYFANLPKEKKETCCMCYETKGIYSLRELIEDKENELAVINQAKYLLELGQEEGDRFCEECFWK